MKELEKKDTKQLHELRKGILNQLQYATNDINTLLWFKLSNTLRNVNTILIQKSK